MDTRGCLTTSTLVGVAVICGARPRRFGPLAKRRPPGSLGWDHEPHGFPTVDSLVGAVRANAERIRGTDWHFGLWGDRRYDTEGRLIATPIRGRTFHEVRFVAVSDPAVRLEQQRVEKAFLYFTGERVFRFYVSGYDLDPMAPDVIVLLETFAPLE